MLPLSIHLDIHYCLKRYVVGASYLNLLREFNGETVVKIATAHERTKMSLTADSPLTT
jgi:hypothetical protein